MVLSGVERVGDSEAIALRAHLAKCQPELAAAVSLDLGALLARFDVASTQNRA